MILQQAMFVGNDRIDYIACDVIGNCETARVHISVIPEMVEITEVEEEETVAETTEQVEGIVGDETEQIQETEQVDETVELAEEEPAEEEDELIIEEVDLFEITTAYDNADILKVEFTNVIDERIQYRLVDLAGRTRIDGRFASVYGKNYLELPSSTLEKGIYIIYLNNNRNSDHRKIFID